RARADVETGHTFVFTEHYSLLLLKLAGSVFPSEKRPMELGIRFATYRKHGRGEAKETGQLEEICQSPHFRMFSPERSETGEKLSSENLPRRWRRKVRPEEVAHLESTGWAQCVSTIFYSVCHHYDCM